MLVEEKIRRRKKQKKRREAINIIDKYKEEKEVFNTKKSKVLGEFE
jgi:hypothetical protein